jgi:microcystin-dependent protein
MSTLAGEGATGPDDDRPLTDREYLLLQRLLGDPFSLPLRFKSWLIGYLETSDLTLPMSAILGLSSTLGISGAGQGTLGIFPAGLILPYGGGSAPTGSLLCDGGSYSRTTQKRLFDAIGTTYGAADSVSFSVPDMRGRVPVGLGSHSDHAALGSSDGSPPGTRRARHSHTPVGWASEGITAGGDAQVVGRNPGSEIGVHDHHPADGTPAPVDTPAFLTINFIIVS